MEIQSLLAEITKKKASDLHLISGYPPTFRINGILTPFVSAPIITPEAAEQLIFSILTQEQKELFISNRELDFSLKFDQVRFRVNVYYQQETIAAAFRLIPFKVPSIEELNLPRICHTLTNLEQGFVLVVGPTGHGKSTTISSILEEINITRNRHIITIEDPIEYVFGKGKSIISQRELKQDTHSWELALRSVLREDPDVVFIGEMRDYDTIASALTIAETGHLVFSTLHTNSAGQTIDRIVDVFPENQQTQVRMQLSSVLEVIISQRLIPSLSGGRLPVNEILVTTPALKTVIREGKTHLIDNIIQTSAEMGMQTIENNLVKMVLEGKINLETAQRYAFKPEEVMRLYRTYKK